MNTNHIVIARPALVPADIAVCPECQARLWWQLTCHEDDFGGLELDCSNEPDDVDQEDEIHSFHQGDWQPVIDRVKTWLRSAYRKNL